MPRYSVKDIDKGWKKIKRSLAESNNKSVDVGVLPQEGRKLIPGKDINLATLASVHEYGADINHPGGVFILKNRAGESRAIKIRKGILHIPKRSFIGAVFEEKQWKITESVRKFYNDMFMGKLGSVKSGLGNIGEDLENMIKHQISTGKYKPLSELQKWYKGHGQALVDTGRLYNSISYKIRKG